MAGTKRKHPDASTIGGPSPTRTRKKVKPTEEGQERDSQESRRRQRNTSFSPSATRSSVRQMQVIDLTISENETSETEVQSGGSSRQSGCTAVDDEGRVKKGKVTAQSALTPPPLAIRVPVKIENATQSPSRAQQNLQLPPNDSPSRVLDALLGGRDSQPGMPVSIPNTTPKPASPQTYNNNSEIISSRSKSSPSKASTAPSSIWDVEKLMNEFNQQATTAILSSDQSNVLLPSDNFQALLATFLSLGKIAKVARGRAQIIGVHSSGSCPSCRGKEPDAAGLRAEFNKSLETVASQVEEIRRLKKLVETRTEEMSKLKIDLDASAAAVDQKRAQRESEAEKARARIYKENAMLTSRLDSALVQKGGTEKDLEDTRAALKLAQERLSVAEKTAHEKKGIFEVKKSKSANEYEAELRRSEEEKSALQAALKKEKSLAAEAVSVAERHFHEKTAYKDGTERRIQELELTIQRQEYQELDSRAKLAAAIDESTRLRNDLEAERAEKERLRSVEQLGLQQSLSLQEFPVAEPTIENHLPTQVTNEPSLVRPYPAQVGGGEIVPQHADETEVCTVETQNSPWALQEELRLAHEKNGCLLRSMTRTAESSIEFQNQAQSSRAEIERLNQELSDARDSLGQARRDAQSKIMATKVEYVRKLRDRVNEILDPQEEEKKRALIGAVEEKKAEVAKLREQHDQCEAELRIRLKEARSKLDEATTRARQAGDAVRNTAQSIGALEEQIMRLKMDVEHAQSATRREVRAHARTARLLVETESECKDSRLRNIELRDELRRRFRKSDDHEVSEYALNAVIDTFHLISCLTKQSVVARMEG